MTYRRRRHILRRKLALGLALAAVAAPGAGAAVHHGGPRPVGDASELVLRRDPAKAVPSTIGGRPVDGRTASLVAPRSAEQGTAHGRVDGLDVGIGLGIVAGLVALGIGVARRMATRTEPAPHH